MTLDQRPAPPAEPPDSTRWYDIGFRFTPRQALLLLAFLAVGVAFSYLVDWVISTFVDLDSERITEWIDGFGLLAPAVYIALLAVAIIFSPLPSVPINIAGGLAFGVFFGALYTMIGGMIGATVNFALARRFGRAWVERRLGAQATAHIDQLAERMGFRIIFFMRLIPLFNFDWVSYAAGLTSLSFRRYALASVLGMIPPVLGIMYVGDNLLSHPGRSSAMFTALVVWSALPPVAFLLWAGWKATHRRIRGIPKEPDPTPD